MKLTKSQRRSLSGQIKWLEQHRSGVTVCAYGGAVTFMYRKGMVQHEGYTISTLTPSGQHELLRRS